MQQLINCIIVYVDLLIYLAVQCFIGSTSLVLQLFTVPTTNEITVGNIKSRILVNDLQSPRLWRCGNKFLIKNIFNTELYFIIHAKENL